jgi:hypothetical protein
MKLPHVLWRLAAMFFALTAGAHATEFHIKRIDANTVKFDGLITKDSKDALLAALDDRVTMLRITSPGGDLWAGIIIGKFVHDHRKMTEPIQEVVLTEKNNVTHFPPDQLQAALERLETLNKQGIEATVSMEVKLGGKDYSDMIYFPNRKTLERFGITGITAYPYPATEAELKTMNVFKTVPGAIVIGDFEEGALAEVAKTAEMATN